MSSTPLILVRDAFWTLLEADSDFAAAVPAGFRIKATGAAVGDDDTDTRTAGHAPTVQVVLVECRPHIDADSSAWQWRTVWAIVTRSNRQRSDQILDLQWYVFKALRNIATYFTTGVTFSGENIVKTVYADQQQAERKQLKALVGQEVLWSCVADLWFTRAIVT